MNCMSRRPGPRGRGRELFFVAHASACATALHHSGFFLAMPRILVTSPRYGAPQRGPGLSGNLDSSAFAQLVGAADALARGVRPSGERTRLDGHVHPGYAVPSRETP